MSRFIQLATDRPRLGVLAALVGLIGLLSVQGICAERPPILSLDSIAPAGIGGRLLLCGPDVRCDGVLSALGEGDRSSGLWVLGIGRDGPAGLPERLRKLAANGAIQWRDDWPEQPYPRLLPATELPIRLAWIHADIPTPDARPASDKFVRFVQALWADGGTLILSGRAAESACESIVTVVEGDTRVKEGCGVLPGTVWLPPIGGDVAGEAPPIDAPGRIQCQLEQDSLLFLDGRRWFVPRSCPSGATIWLPPTGADAPRQVRVDRDHPADLTTLRRVAILRGFDPVPPMEGTIPEVPHGALMIVGGGAAQDEVTQRFVDLAGGAAAKIIVVPTASEQLRFDDHRDAQRFREAGAGSVTLLHTHDRAEAMRDEFLAPLREATGVWFPGGRQWRLVDAYAGTPFVDLCRQVLERDGVIGGTSAGATIQGDFLVRGHPLGNEIMMAEGYEQGFGFLPRSAIDQHFTQRGRERDLELVKCAHPQLVCLGIDESTALLVRGTRGRVIGQGTVSVYDEPAAADDPQLLTRRTVLPSGGEYDFRSRQVVTEDDPCSREQ